MKFAHALLPGSYDPVTLGHLSLFKRAALFCEKISACVFVNPQKKCLFSLEQRRDFLALACADIPGATAHYHTGFEPEFTKAHGCDLIIKGIRNEKDLAYEYKIVEDWAKANGVDYLLFVGDVNEKGELFVQKEYPIKGAQTADFCPPKDVPPMLLLPCENDLANVSSTAVRTALENGESLSHLLVPSTEKAIVQAFWQMQKNH